MIPEWIGKQKIDDGRIVQNTEKGAMVVINPDCADQPSCPTCHSQNPCAKALCATGFRITTWPDYKRAECLRVMPELVLCSCAPGAGWHGWGQVCLRLSAVRSFEEVWEILTP